MLPTNIQVDDFLPTLVHFLERIEIERAEEREWIRWLLSMSVPSSNTNGVLHMIGAYPLVSSHNVGSCRL
jgi:hypothetical protein